jgi:hypothetical protein
MKGFIIAIMNPFITFIPAKGSMSGKYGGRRK